MGKWGNVWLHLRKTDGMEQPKGASNEGLLIKGPTNEPAFGVTDPTFQLRSSPPVPPTIAVPIGSIPVATVQPVMKAPLPSDEAEKSATTDRSKATKVDVFRAIGEIGRPNYHLAALMLRQIFLVKHRAAEDSWPKYQAALSKLKENRMSEIDMEYQNKIREMAEMKKDKKAKLDKKEKRRAYKNYIEIRDATLKYVKKYIDLLNETLQTMDIEATKYEELSRAKKISLNEKTQKVTEVALQIKTRLDLQFDLIKSTTSLIEKIKSMTEGLLTLKGIRGAIGIVSSYIVVIAGAKFTVTTQKFKQAIIEFFSNNPSIEKIVEKGMIYIQWIAGTVIALAGMGLFTKVFEAYYTRRLARKEAAELSTNLGRLNRDINDLKADIKKLSDERDRRMEELIVALKGPISVLEKEYKRRKNTACEQKADLIIDSAVTKHLDSIKKYVQTGDESTLYPAIGRIIKRSKCKISFNDAKNSLIQRIKDTKFT